MENTRRTDREPYKKYRPSRFFKEDGSWFFATREGSTEGPFECHRDAAERLETYIRIANSGFYGSAAELSLVPIELR